MILEKHIQVEDQAQKAVPLLCAASGLSKQAIKKVMAQGAVWLSRGAKTRRLRRVDKSLRAGDCLHLYYNSQVLSLQTPTAELMADEGSYSLWYKPCGMLSQGSKWGDHCTINRWAEHHLQPQRTAFVVHRLDRAARGLMLLAHQQKTAAYFSNLFQKRQIGKRYQAIVQGHCQAAFDLAMPLDGKVALTHVYPQAYDEARRQSLLEVHIETGRKHQIRRHLATAGFPLVGDRLYGNAAQDEVDLCLASSYLAFAGPDDGRARVYTLPDTLGIKGLFMQALKKGVKSSLLS